jgi:WD40 repeat protein
MLIVAVLAVVLSQDEQPRTQPTTTRREKDKTAEVNPDGKTAVPSAASNSPVGNDDPELNITLGPTVQTDTPNGDPDLTAEKQEKLGRSVVAIIASRGTTVERGSGLIVDPKGIIITSSQLVGEANRLRVVFQGGQQVPAQRIMAVHPEWGVAFLQIARPDKPMPVMAWASASPQAGDRLLALSGTHGGQTRWSPKTCRKIRTGSDLRQDLSLKLAEDVYAKHGYTPLANWVEVTGSYLQEQRGGPVLNMQGRVVGLSLWAHPKDPQRFWALSTADLAQLIANIPSANSGTTAGVKTLPEIKLSDAGPVRRMSRFTGHKGPVRAIAVSRNESMIATAGDDGLCYVLDARTMKTLAKLGPHNSSLTGVAFANSPDGPIIITSSLRDDTAKASIFFWRLKDRSLVKSMADTHHRCYDVQLSPSARVLAVGMGNASRVYFLDHDDRRVGLEGGRCRTVAFSPDGRYLFCAMDTGFQRWAVADGTLRPASQIGEKLDSVLESIAIAPDSRFIFTGHADGGMRIRDMASGRILGVCQDRGGAVISIAPLKEPIVAAGNSAGNIRLWDAGKQKVTRQLVGHTKVVYDLEYLKNTDRLVSCSADGTVRIWSLSAKNDPSPKLRPASDRVIVEEGTVPRPKSDQLAAAKKLIREIFKDDLAAAKKLKAKSELAKKLFDQSRNTENEAERFALLSESGRVAIAAGDPTAAIRAARAMAARYAVDSASLKAKTLESLAATAKTRDARRDLVQSALKVAEEATAQNRYQQAIAAANFAARLASRVRDTDLTRETLATRARAKRNLIDWEAYQTAKSRLADKPEDAEANQVAGEFNCFTLGDWPRGLKQLVKSNNPQWVDVARAEQSAPKKADDQTALADQWLALSKTVASSKRRALLERAKNWYEQARPRLSSLKRIAVDRNLKRIDAELP